MLTKYPDSSTQSSFFDITSQLDTNHALMMLTKESDWHTLDEKLPNYYSDKGHPDKPLRLMADLLMFKSLYNHSDESFIDQWLMNPYYLAFCGIIIFKTTVPCHLTELVKFKNSRGQQDVDEIFSLSVKLHGRLSDEKAVLVDTTVQKKAISYPTDMKLSIMIINVLMAACARNLKKWMLAFLCVHNNRFTGLCFMIYSRQQQQVTIIALQIDG